MNTCKTCAYWTTDRYAPRGHRACACPSCDTADPSCSDTLVCWGGDAEVYVGPDFGCIHHEAKQ